ncbi:MAG: hypothetical protein JST50_23000 [Bacteroidetes bacterium]|jgi:hypothetical protein|nr:hypothetical protein [Bacteroidota bacterium]
MVVKYLLATLSALANKLTSSLAIETDDNGNAYTFNKDGINYLNVSPSWGRFLKRKRKTIDLLPKSIIMAMVLVVLMSVKSMAAVVITITGTTTPFSTTYGTASTAQTVTVSASGLTTGSVVINALTGYEYSTNGTTFSTTLTLARTGAGLTGQPVTIYIRLSATAAAGSPSGNISATNNGTTYNNLLAVTGTVTPKALTITATGPSKSYGTALTAGTYTTNFTATGMVGTETVTSVTLTPDAAGLSSSTPQGSAYVVTPSGGTGGNGFLASNYNITYVAYNGTVTGAILTITATNVTQTYGAVDVSVITFTYSGWINGDGPGNMIVVPSISTTATNSSGAGTYPITVSGAQAPSYYTIVYVQGTFTVNKAALIIAATGPAKAAGATLNSGYNTAYYTVNGLITGDVVDSVYLAVSPTTSQTAGSTYTVTPSLAAGANIANYSITYTSYGGTVGQNYTWTGATNSTWSTSTNWSPNGVPGTNDNAIIPGGTANAPDITASTNVNTISFTAGTGNTYLTLEAGVNVLFYNGFTVNTGANLTVNMASTTSKITVGTTSSRALLDNLGTSTFNNGIVYITWGLNYIYNEQGGTITFQQGNTLDIDGTSGQLAMENSGYMYIGTSNSPCTLNIVHSQSVINEASGNFFLGSTSSINFLDNAAHDSHFTNTSGGNFTIQSDQYGTGSIGKIPNNPGTHQNSFNGLFTCERYITGYRGYRLVASPVYAATSGSNNVYSLNYVKSDAYISGTGAAGGFDKVITTSQGPTLYLFREDVAYSNATFISGNFQSINSLSSGNAATPTYTFDVTSGSYSIPVSNGFLFFYRGYRYSATYTKAMQFTPGTAAEASTLSTTGYLNQQQVVFRDWYTPSSTLLGCSNSNVAAKGFNLVANPYACSIDWNTQQSTTTTSNIYALNLSPYIYEFDQRTGNYDTYNSNGTYTNNGTRTIMSGQAFFVLALNSSAQLIFNEGAKSTTLQNTGVNLLMGTPADMLARSQSLRLEIAKDTINKDDTFISFNPNAKTTLDFSEDAPYRPGSGKVNISTISSDNHFLAINLLPFNNQGQTIPVKMGATAEGAYTLNMKEINGIPKFFDVLIADYDAKDTVDMRQGPYTFNVSWADTNSYGAHRFAIIMRQNPAYAYQLLDFNAHKVPNSRSVEVVWDTKNEENYTNFTVERSVDGGQTFTVLGGVPATATGNYGFTDKNPVAGMNLYRLKQEDINNKITYSQVVPIGYANAINNFAQNSINIYPNPAAGRINLAIAAPTATPGSYSILITNSSGNMLKKVTSNEPYWQGDATSWMPGTYMVKVFDAKTQSLIGTTKFVKL